MKAFAIFLTELNDGQTHSAITADLAELLQTVHSTGRGGSLTLKVKIRPAGKGAADKVLVEAERKLELPKPEVRQDMFWLTDASELSRHHPKQGELPLKSVDTKPPQDLKQVS